MPIPRLLQWNERLKLVFSDVDDTIAGLYCAAEPEMLVALTRLIGKGTRIVLITGQGVSNVEERVVKRLPAQLRNQIAVGACSGAQLWGYSTKGERNGAAFDTADDELNDQQKTAWREIIGQLVDEFRLITHQPLPTTEFTLRYGDDPWQVMLEDRGPQITLEFPNAFQLTPIARDRLSDRLGRNIDPSDFRIPVFERAQQLLEARLVPVTPRLAGTFALDFAILGVSKTRSVQAVLDPAVLNSLGLGPHAPRPDEVEAWGDRFSHHAGTDWLMCTPLDRSVRAISFRDEDPVEFPQGYNIQLWNGRYRLHNGLLEFLDGCR
jgi:hydroxymethylpyrimidine pyrophosphatase-like HAD family hydrolase